jgi:hypothetical protein
MSCPDTIPPLDLGTLRLGRVWDGMTFGIYNPTTALPMDLTGATAHSHWRPSKTAYRIDPADDAAILELTSDNGDITFIDGTGDLETTTFDDYMAAWLPGDPLPSMGYPWMIAVVKRIMEEDLPPGDVLWDLVLDIDGSDPRHIREGTATFKQVITRV